MLAAALAVASLAACPSSAPAQQPQFRTGDPVLGTDGLRTLPRGAYVEEPTGITQRSLFRDTAPPYYDNLQIQDRRGTMNGGDAWEGSVRVNVPNFRAQLPYLSQGFEPQDADLKLGPVYFDLRALRAGLLFSDNIRLDDDDRDADVIAIVSLTGAVIVQFTESIRLTAAGSFTFLPLEGEAGVSGFSLLDYSLFGLSGGTLAKAQLAHETRIAGWPVVFADDFSVELGSFSTNLYMNADFYEGGGFDEYDQAGRYVFRAPIQDRNYRERDNRDLNDSFLYYRNRISATTERLLPGEVRLRAQIYHENLWYNQGRRGLPDLRQGANVYLRSERENMRFKPYLSYRALRVDLDDAFDHQIRLGVRGPITEQLELDANIGYFHDGERGNNSLLWRVSLDHVAGPYTRHGITYARYTDDFNEDLRTSLSYHIQQILGPKLQAHAFAEYATIEDLEDDYGDRTEKRLGMRLLIDPGPKSRVMLSGYYAELESDNDLLGDATLWVGQAKFDYWFTETFLGQILYRYQQREDDRDRRSFYENMVLMTLTKYFR